MNKNSSSTLNVHTNNNVTYFTFPSFEKISFINHAFSSRLGGVSPKGPYGTLNMGFKTEDSIENVYQNYKILCDAIDVDHKLLVFSSQTHGTNIRCVTQPGDGESLHAKDQLSVDGLITNIPNVPLVTVYADCVPIFFVDPVNRVVALAHSGWKGTVAQIGTKMVETFVSKYNSLAKNILVGIGPSIGSCCFEVNKDTYSQFEALQYIPLEKHTNYSGNKRLLNLWSINKTILINAGILEKNITMTDMCTKCNEDIFFSFRRDNSFSGRMAAIIALKQLH